MGKYRIAKRVFTRDMYGKPLGHVKSVDILGADPDTKSGVKITMRPGNWDVADPESNYYPVNEEGERQLFHATPSKLDSAWASRDIPKRLIQQILAVTRAEALKHGTGELTYSESTNELSGRLSLNALNRGDVIENPDNDKRRLEYSDEIYKQMFSPEAAADMRESARRTGDEIGKHTFEAVMEDPRPNWTGASAQYNLQDVSSDDLSKAMKDSYAARKRTQERMPVSEEALGKAQIEATKEYVQQKQATAKETNLFGEPLDPRSLYGQEDSNGR
jgi:hypothetical protein